MSHLTPHNTSIWYGFL